VDVLEELESDNARELQANRLGGYFSFVSNTPAKPRPRLEIKKFVVETMNEAGSVACEKQGMARC
jgi:hypothetical protein